MTTKRPSDRIDEIMDNIHNHDKIGSFCNYCTNTDSLKAEATISYLDEQWEEEQKSTVELLKKIKPM